MRLAVGTRVGSYEIVATLGAGGMGEVYRARDTTLGRDVAIKVLAPACASDPERLARFEREARVLASLNHPNVGAIYGVVRQTASSTESYREHRRANSLRKYAHGTTESVFS